MCRLPIYAGIAVLSLGMWSLAAASDDLNARFLAADEAKRHSDWKRVAEISSDILARHPAAGRAWYRLGTAKMNLNDYAGAEAAFGAAAKIHYFELQSWQLAASSAAQLNDKDSVLGYLKKLADRGFDQPGAIKGSPEFSMVASDPTYQAVLHRMQKNIHWQSVNPQWSKDGKTIIFERGLSEFPSSASQIYSIDPDGKNETQLTFAPIKHLMPDFSPDRKQIVFAAVEEGKRRLQIENLRSHESRVLIRETIGNQHFPSWSPDGARIVFNADGTGQRQIYVVNVDGSGLKQLTDAPSNSDYPRWISAAQISFESERAGMWDTYVMDADGGSQTRLARASTPSVSSDGKTVVYTDVLITGHTEVYVMNRDGSSTRFVTNSGAENWQPAWSPNRKQILFQSRRRGHFEVYLMNSDGTGLRRLTRTEQQDKLHH